MPARKGTRPPNAGKGRKAGTPNKMTADLKEMTFGALQDAGGREYLRRQADDNPTAFMGLVGKFVPRDLKVGGDPENPIRHAISNSAIQAIADVVSAIAGARAVPGDASTDPK